MINEESKPSDVILQRYFDENNEYHIILLSKIWKKEYGMEIDE